MGQTASHKHMRNEFLKNPNFNQQIILNNQTSLTAADYPNDESIEDDEIAAATLHSFHSSSHSSYSPGESVPTFKFPNRTEPMMIKQENLANKKIPVIFKYSGKLAKEVYLVGSFTGWKDKILMVKSDGDFITIVDLPEGEHQYKFVVDSRWEHDLNQPIVDDNFSGKNNIVIVKKSDFEVMEALASDSIQNVSNKTNQSNDDLSKSPPGEYTDDIPVRGLNTLTIDKPPYLPPQLLNIVLNKDTSVRDGVMVLSSTYRYKQKFVTTCFYKPI